MLSKDMLVETPLVLAELEDRNIHEGHETESQCTYCGVGLHDPWYKCEDVVVVRHWQSVSDDKLNSGHWTWYCPKHFEGRRGNWWPHSHLAPAHLLPEEVHLCTRQVGLGSACDLIAIEPFDGIWLCEQHATAERVNRRISDLLSTDDDEDPTAGS